MARPKPDADEIMRQIERLDLSKTWAREHRSRLFRSLHALCPSKAIGMGYRPKRNREGIESMIRKRGEANAVRNREAKEDEELMSAMTADPREGTLVTRRVFVQSGRCITVLRRKGQNTLFLIYLLAQRIRTARDEGIAALM